VILLLSLVAGLVTGLAWAYGHKTPYHPPELRHFGLAFTAYLPQFVAIQLPALFPDWLDAACLILSQAFLFGFAWLNRKIIGMPILICGVALNLAVMAANGGFMPISPQTASRLISEEALLDIQPGSRIGPKDILLLPQDTHLEWLADRFLPVAWFPYQVAFSLGDVFIAIGAFWILACPNNHSSENRGT